jgi:hypothetical protein
MLVYSPRIGGVSSIDEAPYGIASVIVGLTLPLLVPKLNETCYKQFKKDLDLELFIRNREMRNVHQT